MFRIKTILWSGCVTFITEPVKIGAGSEANGYTLILRLFSVQDIPRISETPIALKPIVLECIAINVTINTADPEASLA